MMNTNFKDKIDHTTILLKMDQLSNKLDAIDKQLNRFIQFFAARVATKNEREVIENLLDSIKNKYERIDESRHDITMYFDSLHAESQELEERIDGFMDIYEKE